MNSVKHIVLVTYGEPPTASFVEQLAYSWRILLGLTRTVADIPAPLIPLIALSRGRGRNVLWRKHAYQSPLEQITVAQAAAVQAAMARASNDAWKVHVAYEFRHPLLPEVVDTLPPTEPIMVVPMYAADSAFTHQLTRMSIEGVAAGRPAPIVVLPALDPAAVIEMSAAHVMHSISGDGTQTKDAVLVLAAHGTLLEPQKPIETGRVATEQLCDGIQQKLSKCFGMIANGWLNHSRGGKWTEPPIEETLTRVHDAGFRNVVYYPYGFLADNAESQLEGRLAAAAHRDLRVRFVPCLNDSPVLADAIAAQVLSVP